MANEFVARRGFISLGGVILPEVSVSSTYTILSTDFLIDCTSNSFTVNLPTAVGISGKVYQIKNSGSGTITLDANGSQTIDGSLTKSLGPNDVIQVTSDGSNWLITGGIGTTVISNSAKSGSVSSGSFTGNPKTYDVVFSSSFPSSNYSPVVTGGDARSWTVENISASGFTINSNSNTSLSNTTFWIAVLNT
jgi:hypothetical protein